MSLKARSKWAPIALAVGVVIMIGAIVAAATVLPGRSASDESTLADPTGSPGAYNGAASPNGDATTPGPTTSAPAPTTGPAAPTTAARPPAGGGGSGGCAFAVSGGVCPIAPPVQPAPGKRWTIGFAEEFSGSTLDKSKLTPCFDWNYGACTATFNNGRERYQPSQVVVSNGTAKLIAEPLNPPYANDACQNDSCTYKAGLLSTARPQASNGNYLYAFTYGYVESAFKFPATQGFFTAFWMLPADPSFNYRSEIDILEMLGDDPSTMFMTYNYNNRTDSFPVNNSKFNNGNCPVKDYSAGFVRMGLDWQPDHIAWYIDGVECARFTNAAAIESGPMQLILHMMVDNDWQRKWNVGLADPTLSRQLEVDYIRVYQQV